MSKPGFRPQPEVAARRARVLALRIEQVPFTEVAAQLGVGLSTVKMDYLRALEQLQADQHGQAHLARARELAKLDQMEQAVWVVLRARHITVQHGKIVGRFTGFARDPDTGETYREADGQPIPVYEEIVDDAPVLAAVDRLVRIAVRRATLTGMDAPVKVEVSDATDQAIRALAAELASGRVGVMEPGGETAAAADAPARGGGTPAA